MQALTESTETEVATLTPGKFLAKLIKGNQSPIELLPDDIANRDLKIYASAAANALTDAKLAVEKIRPLMGRVLVLYKQRPELWKDLQYRSFDHWMSEGVEATYHIPRPEAYDCVRIAEQMGFLPSETLQQIGMNKLKVASKIIGQRTKGITDIEMKQKIVGEWVAAATEEGMTVAKLIAKAEDENIVDEGSLNPKVPITILANTAIKEQWDKMRTDESLKMYLYGVTGQTVTDDLLLGLCMDEAGSEWAAQMAHEQRQESVPQAV
jgi:hypothetical protein